VVIVREHINFERNKDPFKSMDIGMSHVYKNIAAEIFELDKIHSILDKRSGNPSRIRGTINEIVIHKYDMQIKYYSNLYTDAHCTQKEVKDFFIKLLKLARIYEFLEIMDHSRNKYIIYFNFKPNFVNILPLGVYDEMAYMHNEQYKRELSE
jgi:hypothetical protein